MALELMIVVLVFFIVTSTLILLRSMWSGRSWPSLPPSPTALPIIGHLHLLSPLIHQTFRDLASRHGPLFLIRLGSVPVVVASTPELARELLKTHETKFTSRKHSKAIDKLTYSSSFAFAPYGPYWKFVKKLCMWELLGHRTISNFLPVRTQEYRLFLGLLAEKSRTGEAVNLTEELLKLTNNMISQMMFRMRSSGTDGDAGEARAVIRQVTQMFGEFNVSDFIWLLKNVDLNGTRKRIEETHTRYDALLEKIIGDREELRAHRSKHGDEVKDFLDILLDVAEDPNAEVHITRVHIKAMFLDFFTAATDTTAIATEWALAELINHPDVLEKARKEIDKVVGKDRLVSESDGPDLPYIQAIIKESFRLHPPIPMIARKSIEECRVGEYVIPANTMLFVNMWAIGRDPKYWEGPLDFTPERFLVESDGGGPIDVKGQHFQLLPFGSGRRGCPGMSLALQELPVTLAAMIQCFDWKIADLDGNLMKGKDHVLDMSERPGLTTPRANDLICVPVARFTPLEILGT